VCNFSCNLLYIQKTVGLVYPSGYHTKKGEHQGLPKRLSLTTLNTGTDWLVEESGKVLNIYPLLLVAVAFTEWVWGVASVFATLTVFNFAHGQISLAMAMRTGRKDLYFEHAYLLSV
jgi:hypothetical protein